MAPWLPELFYAERSLHLQRVIQSYSDLTEHHGYESVHDPKGLIEIVVDDDDDDPGTC